jgi:protein O-GlcNAc transferase
VLRDASLTAVLSALDDDPAALLAWSERRMESGDADGGVTPLLRAAARAPDDVQAWQELGVALVRAGEIETSVPVLRRAMACAPTRLDVAQQWAEVAARAGHAREAEAELAAQLAVDPLDAVALHATATLYWQEGRIADALDLIEVVAALRPDEAAPVILRAVLLTRTLQINEAESALADAVALAPDDPQLANDHAVSLNRLCRYEEARIALEAHIARFGPTSRAMSNLTNALLLMGDQAGAEAVGRRAAALWPDDFGVRRALCAVMAYAPGVTGEALSDQLCAASPLVPRVLPAASWSANRDSERRLRIGLLSGTLKVHPVGWLTVAGFEALDRDAFEIVVLAHHTAQDFIARRFRALSGEWHDVQPLTNPALAEFARAREIDILIDLGGYGEHGRMPACAERLAPVQIKWVGSQYHTTGLAEMGWMLSDRWETPDGFERFYSERLLRLPDGYVCYAPSPDTPEVGPLPARAAVRVTFGCFNNVAKVTPEVLETWAEILRRVPDARLILKAPSLDEATTIAAMQARCARAGVDLGRLILQGRSPHRAFLQSYDAVDLVLDPFPYSGGLTTCEALFMGVPVLTLPGETFASRHSLSHVSNVGLEGWVATDLADYVARAVAWAAKVDALEALRAGLRERMRRSPLCDAPRFGRGLGAALRHAWREWCRESDGACSVARGPGGRRLRKVDE